MGILGNVELVKRTRDVTLGVSTTGEEVRVTMRAPRLQLVPELRKLITDPTPPPLTNGNGKIRFETDSRGEPRKNKDGQLVPKLNWKDPEFLVQVASVERARTIAMIFECVDFPGASKLKLSDFKNQIEYQLARWRELEDAGCDVGVYSDLNEAIADLGAPMSPEEIEEARSALGVDQATQDAVKEKLGSKAPKGK